MDRKDRFARLGILLTALLMATAEAGPRANQVNFGSQGAVREFRDAVEIGNESGGYVAEYALRLYEMREARQKVKFVGVCGVCGVRFKVMRSKVRIWKRMGI